MNLLERAQAATEKRNAEVAKIVMDNIELLISNLDEKILSEADRGYRSCQFLVKDLDWNFSNRKESNPFDGIVLLDEKTRRSVLKLLSKHYKTQNFDVRSDYELEATHVTIRW